MAQAAYCSQCGTNVWVGPDGRCGNGHDASCLSGHYLTQDSPPQPVAPSPVASATAVQAAPETFPVPPTYAPAFVPGPAVTAASTNVGGRRVGAFIIDYILAAVLNLFVGGVIGFVLGASLAAFMPRQEISQLASVVGFVVGVLVLTSYFALPEHLWGATPGKMLLSIQVVTLDGGRISIGQAYGRNLALFIDLLFIGIVGLITMNGSPLHQRVGDKLAKTAVIRKAA